MTGTPASLSAAGAGVDWPETSEPNNVQSVRLPSLTLLRNVLVILSPLAKDTLPAKSVLIGVSSIRADEAHFSPFQVSSLIIGYDFGSLLGGANGAPGCCANGLLISIIRDMSTIRFLTMILASMLLAGGTAVAQRPERDVAKGRHPNLAAAQRLSRQAWEKIVEAQRANEWDLAGHAQKAKELLDQVNNELKLAAEAANRNRR